MASLRKRPPSVRGKHNVDVAVISGHQDAKAANPAGTFINGDLKLALGGRVTVGVINWYPAAPHRGLLIRYDQKVPTVELTVQGLSMGTAPLEPSEAMRLSRKLLKLTVDGDMAPQLDIRTLTWLQGGWRPTIRLQVNGRSGSTSGFGVGSIELELDEAREVAAQLRQMAGAVEAARDAITGGGIE